MTKASKSPERNTFQKNGFLERQAEKGLTPDNDESTQKMLEYYMSWEQQDAEWIKEEHPDDLEYVLRTTDWILEKVRNSDSYAQNLYAALCNMRWIRRELWPLLKEDYWSCSWRSSGGIIADMLQKGDYIDWYCSGMGGLAEYDTDPEEWRQRTGYVPEGVVTPEIEADLNKLGWIPSPWPDDKDI